MNSVIRRLRSNWPILTVLFLAFLASTSLVVMKGLSGLNFQDGPDYIRSANAIANHLPYPRDNLSWPFFRPPGYPATIAIIWKITFVNSIWILKFFNVICHLGSTFLVYRIAKLRVNPNMAAFCGFLYALNPFSLLQLGGIQTEPLITVLFLLFVYLLATKPTTKSTIALVLVTILSVATRPEYIFAIVPILIATTFWSHFGSASIKRGLVILVILTTSICWWGFQNEHATGSFMPLTDATNFQLWMGSSETVSKNYPLTISNSSTFNTRQVLALYKEMQDLEDGWGSAYKNGSVSQKSAFWKAAYLKNIQSNPAKYVRTTATKAVIFWRPFLSPASYGVKMVLLSFTILFPITIISLVGIFLLWTRKKFRFEIYSFGFTLITLTVVHMLQLPDMRYRIPVFMPFTLLISGVIIGEWIGRKFPALLKTTVP